MHGYFTFHTAGELIFGSGQIARMGDFVRRHGWSRVLIVTDVNLVAAGVVEAVRCPLAEAGVTVEIFSEGRAEPSIRLVEACVAAAKAYRPDAILGLGGGSNIDLAKMAAVVASHGGGPRDYFGADNVPGPVLPIIAVPTTAGTGSEVSGSSVLTDDENEIKVSSLSNYLRPALAVVDPQLTISCPKQATADSGIDALAHAIEAYTAVANVDLAPKLPTDSDPPYYGAHPLGDAIAEKAIWLVGQHLATAVHEPGNLAAREGMALAATLGGMAFSNCGVALVHALEYPLGGVVHCSHGAGNGLLLPYVMQFNLPERADRIARIGELLGADNSGKSTAQAAEQAIQRIVSLRKEIGIPHQLREFGAKRDQLPSFAAKAHQIKRLLDVNPRAAGEAELLAILEEAY